MFKMISVLREANKIREDNMGLQLTEFRIGKYHSQVAKHCTLEVVFKGPDYTPFEKGYFEFLFSFSSELLTSIRAVTPIQHPRIDSDGYLVLSKQEFVSPLRMALGFVFNLFYHKLNPEEIEIVRTYSQENSSSDAFDTCGQRFCESVTNLGTEVDLNEE